MKGLKDSIKGSKKALLTLGLTGLIAFTSGCATLDNSAQGINKYSHICLSESGGFRGGTYYKASLSQNHMSVRNGSKYYEFTDEIPRERYIGLWKTLEKNDIWTISSIPGRGVVEEVIYDIAVKKGNRNREIKIGSEFWMEDRRYFNIINAIREFAKDFATEKPAESIGTN